MQNAPQKPNRKYHRYETCKTPKNEQDYNLKNARCFSAKGLILITSVNYLSAGDPVAGNFFLAQHEG